MIGQIAKNFISSSTITTSFSCRGSPTDIAAAKMRRDSEPWFASALATDRGTQKEESACSYNNSLGSPGSRTHFVIGRGRYFSKRCLVTAVHTCQGLLTRLFRELRHPEVALIGLSVAGRLRRWAPRSRNPASPVPPPERPSAPL